MSLPVAIGCNLTWSVADDSGTWTSFVNTGSRESGFVDTGCRESGDSSVVARWTVDQENVGSNPTHGGNLISVVRSLSGFTQPIR